MLRSTDGDQKVGSHSRSRLFVTFGMVKTVKQEYEHESIGEKVSVPDLQNTDTLHKGEQMQS